ncbi:hypothetical protein [Microbacterium lacus]|uniref:hypothetical protein n=1 Tax=Microbacterium lacus TaxID=415217 RepID=UPI0012FD44D4|nr:hypothetical protein [Microbacterium lacus]
MNVEEIDPAAFTISKLQSTVGETGHVWDALDLAYRASFPGEHIEKVGLARELVLLLTTSPDAPGAEALRDRFGELLGYLAEVLDSAAVEEEQNRSDDKVKRTIKNFARTHTRGISKREAKRLLRELADAFAQSDWVDEATQRISAIRREHELEDSTSPTVVDFDGFRGAIRSLGEKERQQYQDDATKDPAASLLAETPPAVASSGSV